MTKRKINVENLTERQLKNAENKISEKINTTVDNLVTKWGPKLKKFNIDLKIQVVVGEKDNIDVKDKQFEPLTYQYKDIKNLLPIAEELENVDREMIKDLDLAVNDCNELLSRYGMACDMAYANND